MNTVLIQSEYMLAIIPPILRQDYVNLLEVAHKNDKTFIDFIGERVFETEKEIVRLLNIEISKKPSVLQSVKDNKQQLEAERASVSEGTPVKKDNITL